MPGWGWSIAGTAAMLLAAWSLLHPEFRPDTDTIAPSIREALAKTGFAQTQGVSAARMETIEAGGGVSEKWTVEQRIVPIDGQMTEKRTQRQTNGAAKESTGLYVGPFAVIRYSRTSLSLVGSILPYHFWSSSQMSAFVVEEARGFPNAKGGNMRARVTYEDRYAGGEFAQAESLRLTCEVANLIDAVSINPRLSGTAARIDCREELEPERSRVEPNRAIASSVGSIGYSHWYVFNRGWSTPIEGQRTVRFGDIEEVVRWNTKLVSFEPSR